MRVLHCVSYIGVNEVGTEVVASGVTSETSLWLMRIRLAQYNASQEAASS